MEAIYNRRYKINLVFSLVVSVFAAIVTALLSPYIFSKLFPGAENIHGGAAALVFIGLHLVITRKYRRRRRLDRIPFPDEWREILLEHVQFYRTLNDEGRGYFEKRVQVFLDEKRITGVGTEIDDRTRVLVASAAIIPVYKIEDWEYDTLEEVLVYPESFDRDYNFASGERDMLGMVVQSTSSLIISKRELLKGFCSPGGGNTAIHEFIHKIDEGDGEIDGLPVLMLSRGELAEWRGIRAAEIERIEAGRSDLDPYALTGEAEFLAVAGEYFFKNPAKLKSGSPELYGILKKIFKQDTAAILKSEAACIFKRRRASRTF